ncbi:hypothetical protein AVEN_7190-1 [Araneus ventricosus]|uniref:Uncharacterized protein n=1 Tax=Araneus ventricosus TaxID=182803 RepID=A0A4Y2R367_ARAVE|nr:hypothetical protein AVEN_7190-1 [Araneus ventricosus]
MKRFYSLCTREGRRRTLVTDNNLTDRLQRNHRNLISEIGTQEKLPTTTTSNPWHRQRMYSVNKDGVKKGHSHRRNVNQRPSSAWCLAGNMLWQEKQLQMSVAIPFRVLDRFLALFYVHRRIHLVGFFKTFHD